MVDEKCCACSAGPRCACFRKATGVFQKLCPPLLRRTYRDADVGRVRMASPLNGGSVSSFFRTAVSLFRVFVCGASLGRALFFCLAAAEALRASGRSRGMTQWTRHAQSPPPDPDCRTAFQRRFQDPVSRVVLREHVFVAEMATDG